jgi:hypothetical protein
MKNIFRIARIIIIIAPNSLFFVDRCMIVLYTLVLCIENTTHARTRARGKAKAYCEGWFGRQQETNSKIFVKVNKGVVVVLYSPPLEQAVQIFFYVFVSYNKNTSRPPPPPPLPLPLDNG